MIAGQRAQACDGGKCEPITIMAEPQMAADGSWCVLVMFDSRPGYLSSLQLPFLRLKDPDAAPPAAQPAEPAMVKLLALLRGLEAGPELAVLSAEQLQRIGAAVADQAREALSAPHPSQPAEPQRVGLTTDQITAIGRRALATRLGTWSEHLYIARAIEAAHGIPAPEAG